MATVVTAVLGPRVLRQRSHWPCVLGAGGAALLAIGQPREALAHFEEIIRLNPNAAVAHMQRGLALLDGLGRKADAAAEFETVLRLQPDFPGARAALDRARR